MANGVLSSLSPMRSSHVVSFQGTALFMSSVLLAALVNLESASKRAVKNHFPFQHRLCHDLESLIWVVVYAMMVRRRNILAATDPDEYASFQSVLDSCWGGPFV